MNLRKSTDFFFFLKQPLGRGGGSSPEYLKLISLQKHVDSVYKENRNEKKHRCHYNILNRRRQHGPLPLMFRNVFILVNFTNQFQA